ncbi:MAG: two-component system, OmpR family, sensor kinase [Thermoanaerobaculia bacterium]|jgi:heavy metal sensor kinase|nr:two-component system, OmpR family, sensor kinase [Thermoanaerobaculia bacterium]
MSSVRARLAAWSVAATAIFLVLFGAVTYALLLRVLQRRMDASLVETAISFEHALRVELAADARPIAAIIAEEVAELPFADTPLAVFRENGNVVAAPPHADVAQRLQHLARRGRGFATLDRGTDSAMRVFTGPITVSGQTFIVVVARRLNDQTEFLEAVRTALLIGIPLWILCAGALGYWLVRKTLQPVLEMSEEAAAIGASDLTRRIPVRHAEDELGHLALTFNALLDRVRAVLVQQRRFMTDASHELRTPVAIVRGEAEVALSKHDRSAGELRESMEVIEQESRLLSSIIDDLFLLARADAGQAVIAPSTFYLDELIAEVVRAQRSLAARKSIEIVTALAPETAIRADERLLRRMLVNLADNAVKYTPPRGRVEVGLRNDGESFVITIANSGPAIPDGVRAHLFERFYRGDASSSDGAGLGLPIAQSIAELHGGTISVAAGDIGNVFTVRIESEDRE